MTKWLKIVLLLTVIGVSKAHQIKLLVLAVLGLAGLWMVHTLAQDYHKISGSSVTQGAKYLASGSRGISKRSIEDFQLPAYPAVEWDKVIDNDPSSCARSFTCQLAAIPDEQVKDFERIILSTIRSSTKEDNWANNQIKKALDYGTASLAENDNFKCQKLYKQCPYTLKTMMKLIKLLGDFGDIQNKLASPMMDV